MKTRYFRSLLLVLALIPLILSVIAGGKSAVGHTSARVSAPSIAMLFEGGEISVVADEDKPALYWTRSFDLAEGYKLKAIYSTNFAADLEKPDLAFETTVIHQGVNIVDSTVFVFIHDNNSMYISYYNALADGYPGGEMGFSRDIYPILMTLRDLKPKLDDLSDSLLAK